MTWTVEFYEEENGISPVEEFLAKLPRGHRAKALAIVELLKEAGPTLPFPYSSQVRGKIRELRTQHGKDRIRILYFADKERRFILLHAFIKRTAKLSENDIGTAERRMKKHEQKTGNTAKNEPETGRRKRRHLRGGMGSENKEVKWHGTEGTTEEGTECKAISSEDGITAAGVELTAEHGEGKFLWNQEEGRLRMWFEGNALCGNVKFDLPHPEDPRPMQIVHQCEDEEGCFLEEFMDEIGIEVQKKGKQWFVN